MNAFDLPSDSQESYKAVCYTSFCLKIEELRWDSTCRNVLLLLINIGHTIALLTPNMWQDKKAKNHIGSYLLDCKHCEESLARMEFWSHIGFQ